VVLLRFYYCFLVRCVVSCWWVVGRFRGGVSGGRGRVPLVFPLTRGVFVVDFSLRALVVTFFVCFFFGDGGGGGGGGVGGGGCGVGGGREVGGGLWGGWVWVEGGGGLRWGSGEQGGRRRGFFFFIFLFFLVVITFFFFPFIFVVVSRFFFSLHYLLSIGVYVFWYFVCFLYCRSFARSWGGVREGGGEVGGMVVAVGGATKHEGGSCLRLCFWFFFVS